MNSLATQDIQAEEILAYHSANVTVSIGWDKLQPSQGTFAFSEWDTRRQWLIDNDKLGLWHTGVWHIGQPAWLVSALAAISPPNPTAVRALITAHFQGIQAHTGPNLWPYRYFTAVNEVIDGAGLRPTNWLAAYGGDGYIDWTFVEARRLWPQLRLVFNFGEENYGGVIGNGVRAAALSYLTAALGRGVPIDAVGIEGHLAWARADMG